MHWTPMLIGLIALVGALVWVLNRVTRARGKKFVFRCSRCGRDLHGKHLHGDPEGRLRCPFCGEDVEDESPLKLSR